MAKTLFMNKIAAGVSGAHNIPVNKSGIVFQALLYGSAGAATATVLLYGSNDPLVWGDSPDLVHAGKQTLATFTLSGTGGATCADNGVWLVSAPYMRFWAEVTAITGTGAAVTLIAST
jgi:hypothetical protein